MRRLIAPVMAAALLTPTLASAQEGGDTEIMQNALAAGYKALFTCSATFTAGKSLNEIEFNELDGIYVDYRKPMRSTSEPSINDRNRTVAVRYERGEPPRIAVWRDGLGCSLLPIGADPSAEDWLPRFGGPVPRQANDVSTAIGSDVQLVDPTFYNVRLEAPVNFAFDGNTYGRGNRTSAVVIVKDGQVMAERYGRGMDAETPQRTWSVAKSLTATIIGAALEQGMMDLDYPALVENWTAGGDPRRNITLRDTLQMASGLDSGVTGSRTDRTYFGGARVVDTALTNPLEVTPGERFKYSNYDTLAAMRGLRETMKDDPRYWRFPYEALLHKIGALNTTLETDWGGDFVSSSQVWMTARDMARLGQLYIQDGYWAGERILPQGFVDFVRRPGAAQPDRTDPGSFGYGASFWLLDRFPGIPSDTYAGIGNRGQYLVIVPSLDIVIVRRGFDVAGQEGFDIVAFTRDVLSSIDMATSDMLAAQTAASDLERQRD